MFDGPTTSGVEFSNTTANGHSSYNQQHSADFSLSVTLSHLLVCSDIPQLKQAVDCRLTHTLKLPTDCNVYVCFLRFLDKTPGIRFPCFPEFCKSYLSLL